MTTIDYLAALDSELIPLCERTGIKRVPEMSRRECWFIRECYSNDHTALYFDCEASRDFGCDVRFGNPENTRVNRSFHTFLRLYDLPLALEMGRSLPSDQGDMVDIVKLYVCALLKHQIPIFDDVDASIEAMDADSIRLDLANQDFLPTGRFLGKKVTKPNQSTDPTLASGTSGAGHQPRHP